MRKVTRTKPSKKVHVLWLHSHFLYWMGGTKFVYEVCKRLQKSKRVASLSVIVENIDKLAESKYQEIGVPVISMGGATSTSWLYWLCMPLFLLRDIFFVRQYVSQNKMSDKNTVIISSMFPMNVVASVLGFRHVQNCYEPFAFFYDEEFVAKFPPLKQLGIGIAAVLYRWLDKWGTRQAHTVLTLNNVTQELMHEVYGVASDLTQAGVDSTVFKPFISKKIAQTYKNKAVLIHSTDYTPVKGTDRVIKAMQVVVAQNKRAHLLITTTIDNKEAEQQLRQLATELGIAKQVTFLGFVSITELPQYYSLALGLVQGSSSSRSGTTSMALPVKEALCCETPAIRPAVGSEDIIDGTTGFIVDPRDTQKLSEKMLYLVSNPTQAKSMGKKGRAFITQRYTWEKTTNVFEKHL